MPPPKDLKVGVRQKSPTPDQEKWRIEVVRVTVEKYLPEFAKAVRDMLAIEADTRGPITLHQDAFAAGYHDDEYTLLGMAIKYAGLSGVSVMVMGTNHETF